MYLLGPMLAGAKRGERSISLKPRTVPWMSHISLDLLLHAEGADMYSHAAFLDPFHSRLEVLTTAALIASGLQPRIQAGQWCKLGFK